MLVGELSMKQMLPIIVIADIQTQYCICCHNDTPKLRFKVFCFIIIISKCSTNIINLLIDLSILTSVFTRIPRFFFSEDLELRINDMNITNYIKLF